MSFDEIINDLQKYRIDVRYTDNPSDIDIIGDVNVSRPDWIAGFGGVVSGAAKKQHFNIKTHQDGKLIFIFRGRDCRYNNERFPVWIDYTSIKIDGQEVLDLPVATWHDKPFYYHMSVKQGQEITIEIEQQYHQYPEEELRDVLIKLNQGSDYVKENIDKIIARFEKVKLVHHKDFPKITADCFIPIGVGCRTAEWMRRGKLRFCSLPFDWLGKYKLSFVLKTIANGIDDWFAEYRVDSTKANKKCHCVYDTKNNFRAMHAFPLDKTVEEYKPEFKEVFGKRYERLIGLIKESKNICFVCNDRVNSVYDFYLFVREVQKLYPNKKYQFLHIHHNNKKNEIIEYKFVDNIIIYNIEAYDIHKNGNDESTNPEFWIGNEELWTKICANLKVVKS